LIGDNLGIHVAAETQRPLKNSLDYRFYDFVKIFQKRSWELQQFTL
jgi:hypothetical protein